MKKTSLLRCAAALSAAVVLLAGCGGGGDGGSGGGSAPPQPEFIQPTTPLGSSRQYSEAVAGCSIETQKKFVRSYLDEVYLWYDEIVDVDPAAYASPEDYFYALLVTTPDANGVPKDRFSEALPESLALNFAQQSGTRQKLLAGVSSDAPMPEMSHTDTVPLTKVVASPNGRHVGYIYFREHDTGAQDDLIAAFQQLKDADVQDLVLDLRDNGGGYLYIALSAASMITGPASEGRVFEKLTYNDKRQLLTAASTLRFSSRVQFGERNSRVGTTLPQLGLQRVFILASPVTCSASESIINGLRGIGVEVIQIGTTQLNETGVPGTCGKPYGFTERNNCDISYFPIEFKGTNALGFGEYTTGFRHTCQVQDDGSAPGSSTDRLLSAALSYVDTGACPTASPFTVQSSRTPLISRSVRSTRPSWAGRLLLPMQQSTP